MIKREFLQNCYWLSLFLGDEFKEKWEDSPKGECRSIGVWYMLGHCGTNHQGRLFVLEQMIQDNWALIRCALMSLDGM